MLVRGLALQLILVFLSSILLAQNDFRKLDLDCGSEKYLSIESDSTSRLLIEATNGHFLYTAGNCQTISLSINDDKIYNDDLDIGPITDTTNYNDQQLLGSMTSGIWIKTDNTIKQWKPEGVVLPSKIMALHNWKDFLFILTTNSQLYYWSQSDYSLSDIELHGLPYITDLTTDDWGNIYLLNDENIYRYSFIENNAAPHIWINSIQSSFNAIENPWDNLIFEKDLILSVAADISFYNKELLEYQYRIKDDQWSASSNESNIHLTNLAPGDYNLQMRASYDGNNFGYSEVVPFKVKGNFIDGFWKYLLFGFIGLSLLWLISFNRNKRQINQLKSSSEKIRLENNLLKSKQKTMQLEMNPHFIFNSLNTIQGLIAQQEYKPARRLLNQFSQMMRSTLDQSREDSISLANEIKYLENYLSLEKAARNNKFDFDINIEGELEDIYIPPMLIQPFVENAIIHGMKGIKKQGKININFSVNTKTIKCVVDDNGVGRSQKHRTDKTHAIDIVNDRIRSYSKFLKLNKVTIKDKADSNNNPQGTTIKIELPIVNG